MADKGAIALGLGQRVERALGGRQSVSGAGGVANRCLSALNQLIPLHSLLFFLNAILPSEHIPANGSHILSEIIDTIKTI